MNTTVHHLESTREIPPSWHPLAQVWWDNCGEEHAHAW